jgi:hypothetical protein
MRAFRGGDESELLACCANPPVKPSDWLESPPISGEERLSIQVCQKDLDQSAKAQSFRQFPM